MATSSAGSDTSTITTILVKDLSAELNKRDTLLEHFSQFGEVTRVQCRGDQTAIVHFKSHNDAIAAKTKGKKISPMFRPVTIQLCKMERQTSSEKMSSKGPLLRTPTGGGFTKADQQTKSPFEGSGSSTTKFKSDASSGRLFEQKTPAEISRMNPFSKKTSNDDSGKVAASLFGKALQKTIETSDSAPPPSFELPPTSTESASAFPTTNLFGKLTETSQLPKRTDQPPTGGLFPNVDKFAKGPTAASPFFQTSSSPIFKLGSLFGSSGPEKQVESSQAEAASKLTSDDLNSKAKSSGFAGLQSSDAPAMLFGKPIPPATSTSDSTPMILFGKPAAVAPVADSTEAKPNFPAKATMLFGSKPEDAPQKDTQVPAEELAKENAENSSIFGASFKSRLTGFGSAFPPPSALKWSVDSGNKQLPTTRPATFASQKPEGGSRARGNLVWVKDRSTAPPSKPLVESSGKNVQDNPFSTEQRDVPTVPAPPRQLNAITRSHTRSSSPSKFAELFVHAANSVGERYKLLDAKDKILRELNSEPQKGPIKGTCTDMCPEKERYHRSLRNLVEKFEMLPGADGVMDHTRMVKEYQRSSADQETPLPHELRPPPVLEMTMNYLINEIIANQPTRNPGDWFTFIWNRTRAIRKDITQQKIEADPTSAVILERCARFHIHCCHSLCEEDHHYFDPKLNNENLTKCLKSLKYSYTDLKVQKVRCPNEVEFVAYEILLNLKEGDITKMITDLEPDMRKQPLIRLAISAMNALAGGNYRRFFRIVRLAPYLAACILHRYFTEVRRHALRVLAKSLSSKGSEMSLSSLTNDLSFNNENECAAFLSVLNIEADENGLVNLKANCDYDDARFEMTKCNEIERKMGESLAQIVYGPGTIPVINYEPVDSFTSDGMLKKSAVGLPDDFKIRETQPIQPVEPVKRPEVTEEHVKPLLAAVVEDVLRNEVRMICCAAANEQAVSLASLGRIIESVIGDEVRKLCQQTYEEEKKDHDLRRRALLSKLAHDFSADLIEVFSSSFLEEICKEQLIEAKMTAISELAVEMNGELLRDVCREVVPEVVKAEYDEILGEHQTDLAKSFRVTSLCRKYVKKWKKWTLLQKEIRDFPAGPNLGAQKEYPKIGKSYAEMEAEQSRMSQMRLLAGITNVVDTVPLNIADIFSQPVRILVIGEISKMILQKVKTLLGKDDSIATYVPQPPTRLNGFNIVILLVSNEFDSLLDDVSDRTRNLIPKPVIGMMSYRRHPSSNSAEIELIPNANEPLCIPLCNLLKKIARKLPASVKLERAFLPQFVNKTMEFCLDKVPTPCSHLRAVVRLYNVIIDHLATVATSATLLDINAIDEEANWNSEEHFARLYKQIKFLELPVPDYNDRMNFIENVQRLKNVDLLTTTVNMAYFKDDFILLSDIHSRLSYTLDSTLLVRYLDDDLRKFVVPDFWYQRPVELLPISRSTSPVPVGSISRESGQNEEEEEEDPLERIDEVIRSARALLRRSDSVRKRKVLQVSSEQNLKRHFSDSNSRMEVLEKRGNIDDDVDDDDDGDKKKRECSQNVQDVKVVSPGRLSKRVKTELDVLEIRRTIATYKDRLRINKLLEDA